MDEYFTYHQEVERRGAFKNVRNPRKFEVGNEQRRFHGTKIACKLGMPNGTVDLCSDERCSTCQIIGSSFDKSYFKSHTNFGRFGHGICVYWPCCSHKAGWICTNICFCPLDTSATSSKADDYVEPLSNTAFKAMPLNRVVVGKAAKLSTNSEDLTAPPTGYDPVIGEPGPDGPLNYDELIVYTNKAIRPAYLIVYRPDPNGNRTPWAVSNALPPA